jgi:hypothetical protein
MESKPDDFETFEEKANEIYEAFLEGMQDDPKYTRPVDDDDPADAEGAQFMYTYRAITLIERLHDRLCKLCTLKFGKDKAFDMNISSHLYQEY